MTAPFTQALMTAQATTQSEVLTSPKASPAPLHRAWPGAQRKVSFTGVSASKVPLIASCLNLTVLRQADGFTDPIPTGART